MSFCWKLRVVQNDVPYDNRSGTELGIEISVNLSKHGFVDSYILLANLTFYRIFKGFHRTFETGVACRQGTLTPPDTWSRPFGTCIFPTCWDHSFFRTCRYFLDYALRSSLGTFSILILLFDKGRLGRISSFLSPTSNYQDMFYWNVCLRLVGRLDPVNRFNHTI